MNYFFYGDRSCSCVFKTEFSLMKNLTFRLLRTYAEARSGAATCSTNFPRVWPATPRSKASLALASGIVSAMTGRIAPESINAAISPSCSRLGLTMKYSPRLLWAAASPSGMGLVKLTRIPVGVSSLLISTTTARFKTSCSSSLAQPMAYSFSPTRFSITTVRRLADAMRRRGDEVKVIRAPGEMLVPVIATRVKERDFATCRRIDPISFIGF